MEDSVMRERLREIPAVDEILRHERVVGLLEQMPRPLAVDAIRLVLDGLRQRIRQGEEVETSLPVVAEEAARAIVQRGRRSLRRAINATGVLLNTGLGRAVLAPQAVEAVCEVAGSHSVLEVEIETGRRGSRLAPVERLLRALTGAPAAAVVNNNAAAVLLALNTLAAGREVIISRGQLVEIGGQFRMPDVIHASGCRMVEVGTTNKTHLYDYEKAITPETALLLHVHPSNYRIVGFAEQVPLPDLVALGHQRGILVVSDLGSGSFFDVSRAGLSPEPTVPRIVATGVDLVTFSGDKLLGGPQAGLLLGGEEVIRRITRNPLMRALRCDKLTLAALEATLRLYLEEKTALQEVPILRALTRSLEEIEALAQQVAREAARPGLEVSVVATTCEVGGGSLPAEELPSFAVRVEVAGCSPEEVARSLRGGDPAIFGRIARDAFLLDMRAVSDQEADEVASALSRLTRPPDAECREVGTQESPS
ncbi:MAG: L-seryl-tRNA(Sec) selenium transferase [Armatimonadetes bacterium]|nr:L-seryl-tRNA(Sec) selenium transferase [Armatimonadota bacterium]